MALDTPPATPDVHDHRIWSTRVPNKVKIYGWLYFKDRLSTRSNLKHVLDMIFAASAPTVLKTVNMFSSDVPQAQKFGPKWDYPTCLNFQIQRCGQRTPVLNWMQAFGHLFFLLYCGESGTLGMVKFSGMNYRPTGE